MSEPQPEYVWAFPDEKPKRGRVWLIVMLVIVALAIAAGLFWLFLRPGLPGATPAPSPTASLPTDPMQTPTPAATTTPTPSTTPSVAPTASAPPPQKDPSAAAFRENVSPVLRDAQRGLQIAGEDDPQEAVQTIGFLQEDAGRLAEVIPPSPIASRWSARLNDYSRSLQTLRAAYESGGSGISELSAARSALAGLDELVG